MYKSVVLCCLQNLQCLRFIDISSVFLCFHYIICHISDGYTPAFRIVRAALSVGQAGTTAGTRACRVFSLIFVQPVGNMFQIYRFIFHLDRFFHRDNMHTDTGTNGVIFSSGRRDICSKKVPISGLESRMFAFMLKNSAHPGTYIGSTYCFSCFGFLPQVSVPVLLPHR